MNDFESDSVKLSSGFFSEISQVDDRPAKEIEIYGKAKRSFERLTGQNIPEPKRVHSNNDRHAKVLVNKTEGKVKEIQSDGQMGFLTKLINRFKKK